MFLMYLYIYIHTYLCAHIHVLLVYLFICIRFSRLFIHKLNLIDQFILCLVSRHHHPYRVAYSMLSMLMYRFSGGHGQDHLAEVDETQDGGWSERVQCGRCGAGNGNADSLHLLAALQATICAKAIAIDLPWKQVDVDLGHFTAGRGNTRKQTVQQFGMGF